jgi:hypothetical protein
MTGPSSGLRNKAVNLAITIFAVALALNLAARLIIAVLPVLIAAGGIALLAFVGWSIYQFRKSRW